MEKILFITNVEPLSDSKEGKSGFTWTIYKFLRDNCYDVRLLSIANNCNKSFISKQLDVFALKRNKINVNWNDFDKILIYPDALLLSIPKDFLCKTIVLAPDATSMARWSKYKAYRSDENVTIVKKIYQYLLSKRFICFENKYIKHVDKYVVVGINDRRWLNRKLPKFYKSKVVYLPHPLVQNAIVNLDEIQVNLNQKKRFIFSGDMSYSYVGKNIAKLRDEFNKLDCTDSIDVLVVGGKNKWVSDILKETKCLNVKYIEWVNDYKDICCVGRDVHCIPLIAGAGTKNRVLVALANALEVISTPKGVENISINGLMHLSVNYKMSSFAQAMLYSNKKMYTDDEIKRLIMNRKGFRLKIQEDFINTMDDILS